MLLSPTVLLAESTNYRITGRVVWEGESCVLAFPGITLESRLTGTERIDLEAVLESGEEAYFNIWVNGHQIEPLHVIHGRESYNLVSQLNPQKSYSLRLVKRTEAWQGKVRIRKLTGDPAIEWLKPGKLPKRKLMTIGDSITCGAAAEVSEPFTREGHHTSNAEAAYGYVLSKLLNAQLHQVSYGGKGLIRDWQGLESEVTAPQFFERIDPDDANSVWDHTQYIPEAIIVCLGQNDFNQGIIKEQVYVRTYVFFCKRILAVYPDAKILLVSSPMHGEQDPKRFALQAYMKLVQESLEGAGIDQVRAFNSKEYSGTSLNAHPTSEQHKQLAHDLLPVIRDWLGWQD
ncbi:MAG: GDSL-type esterase/lipase family protein [Puniceicoccaceae bacterium]